MSVVPLDRIQASLAREGLDGWLLYDFHGQNPVAARVVRFPTDRLATRRWFYFVPRAGEPIAVVHAIESHHLDHLPGRKLVYAGWKEMRRRLEQATTGARRIAMEYSPECNIPYVSRVDAGTVELVRALGKEVASSADLVSEFESRLTAEEIELHLRAAEATIATKDRAFEEIRRRLRAGESVGEYAIQQTILEEFARHGLATSSPPIVAVNRHTADPHYTPTAASEAPIRPGDLILIDLWARVDRPDGIYADFTWMAYAGPSLPERIAAVWRAVADARDAAIRLVEERFERGEPLRGYEVDDAARRVIEERGFGDRFVHRTGHNIGREVHGNGAHMDNFETRDERLVLPDTVFSIEPGVYLDEFGIRSEVDMLVREGRAEVTGLPYQRDVLRLLEG